MKAVGRAAAATVTMIAALSVGASAAASPSPPATTTSTAPANVDPIKHPVTAPARTPRAPSVSRARTLPARLARDWAAEDPYSRVACFTADGVPAGMAVVDRVDPTRRPTAEERMQICREGYPGTSG